MPTCLWESFAVGTACIKTKNCRAVPVTAIYVHMYKAPQFSGLLTFGGLTEILTEPTRDETVFE